MKIRISYSLHDFQIKDKCYICKKPARIKIRVKPVYTSHTEIWVCDFHYVELTVYKEKNKEDFIV